MLERSEKYDRSFVRKCMGGPNALYLTEELTDSMHLAADMTVLDLGCGRALSSVFLAKEYGVLVYAVDLFQRASETYNMLRDIGMSDRVFPIQADAASLPAQPGTFDALTCINSWHNFGMEKGFFRKKIRPLLRGGAEAGFVLLGKAEGYVKEKEDENPAFWSGRAWRNFFEEEGLIVETCEELLSTKAAWMEWMNINTPDMTKEELEASRINPELALIKIVGRV